MLLLGAGLSACNTMDPTATGAIAGQKGPLLVSDTERDCLGRAMYFESKRDDAEGLLAVGTVVMNRLEAAMFPGGICAVVGQPGQFATGVLTKPMREKDLDKIAEVTDAVLAGERHPKVGKAMYFHTAGYRFHYGNMHYVAAAGGNVFYEKTRTKLPATQIATPFASSQVATAVAEPSAGQ
ncbi:cell wall hydrolase [Methylobacterium sp. J-076]|uniref:cell wall hydrolase n=1 Tax=Methylobacterium sp. J-076 TaxID=2836655 RepID=UPI001FBB7FDA|nr:cell wall hydrolase [Methylobacterium sp. J-076]MCJ2013537.1 cell wall hydrolase [Methylobacterium sp. J-076]